MKHNYLASFFFNAVFLSKAYVVRVFLTSIFFLFFFTLSLEAQVIIKTNATPDIAVCQSPEILEVEITANATFTENLIVEVQLPLGISYVSQSIEVIEGTANNLEMVEMDISDATQPIFQINASTAAPFNDGEHIVFQIAREADCMAITYAQSGGTFEDLIVVDFGGGSEEELGAPYNILFASLALFAPNAMSAEAGTVVEREVTIVNGGLACTNSVRYELGFPDEKAAVEEILLNGVSLPFEVVNNGIIVDIAADFFLLIGNGDGCFDDGETLVLTEIILLNGCSISSFSFNHQVSWGCKEQSCNMSQNVGSSIGVTSGVGVKLDIKTLSVSAPSTCSNGLYSGYIANVGSQTVFNLRVNLGWGANLSQNSGVDWDNALVNNQNYALSENGNSYILDFTDNTNSDLGLSNVDGGTIFNDLLPNDTLFFSVEMDYLCGVTYFEKESLNIGVSYKEPCGNLVFNKKGAIFQLERQVLGNYSKGATDIWNDGTDYTFSFCTEGSQTLNCPDDFAELQILAPFDFGLMPIRAYLDDGTPLDIEVVSGELIVVSGIEGMEEECVNVDFQLDCTCFTTPKYMSLDWEYVYTCEEENCDCKENLYSGQYEVFTHCRYASLAECADGNGIIIDIGAGQGDFEGCLMTLNMKAERASLGWTDFTFTEQVDATDEGLGLDLALPCDSIRVESDGLVVSTLADNAYVRVIYHVLYNTEVLQFSSGIVHYVDSQTGIGYDCPVSAEMATNTTSLFLNEEVQTIDINLTETLGTCYPKTQFSALDSINFEGYFRVLDTNYSPNFILYNRELERFRTFHYWVNEDGEELNCDHVGDRMYLNNYEMRVEGDVLYSRSCGESEAHLDFVFEGDRFQDLFPNEVRPYMEVDSIQVILPEGFEYVEGSANFKYLPLDAVPILDPVVEELNDERTKLTFINNGIWALGDKINNNEVAGGLRFNFTNPCFSQEGLIYTYYYKTNYYTNDENCIQTVEESKTIDIGVPSIFAFTTLLIDDNVGYSRFDTVNLRFCNTSNFDHVEPYLLIKSKLNNLNILKVSEVSQSPSSIIGFQQTELEDGSVLVTFEGINLDGGLCIELEVLTEYIDCDGLEFLNLRSSYTCGDVPFPTEYEDVNCTAHNNFIKYPDQPAEVQLQVNSPTEAIPLCEPFFYEFTINSAQLANIYEPVLEVEFPPLGGLALGGIPTIEYPLGTAPRDFVPEFTDTGLRIDLAAADLENEPSANILEKGIEGLGIGTADTRKAIIRMPLNTDCNFISGSSIRASITANRPCGSPATGSGITQLLEPILIEGAVPSYITLTTIDSEAVSYCEANSTVKVQIINEGPATTSADEHCYIFVPENVQYLEGTTESLTENIVGEPLQNAQNTLTQLDFTMPEGVAANDTIVFTFHVDASELAECQDAFVEFIAQTVEFVPLFCVSENAECNLPVKTSEGTGYFDITVGGPEMNLSAIAQTGCFPEASGELMIDVTLLNSGNKAVLTENVAVDIYLDLNNNGAADATDILLDSLTYDSLIDAGESITLTGEWTIDPTLLSPLVFVLPAENYCSGCEDVIFYIPQVNPVSALTLEYNIVCNEDTETYHVFVDVLDGIPPYSITGSASAVINNGNFNIPDIPYGFELEFLVEDGAGCKDTITVNDLCGVTLPVELLSFEGKALKEGNLLQWQTASELNNDYFTLKRSRDGQKFETISTVEGNGTTSKLQDYAFLDTNSPSGIVYYQLSQIDLNSKVKKLKTISIDRNGFSSKLQISSIRPIPAKDFFDLQFFSPTSQLLELQVFDIYSKLVHRQSLAANLGGNDWKIDCGSWGKGVYILELKGRNETVFVKVVVQ